MEEVIYIRPPDPNAPPRRIHLLTLDEALDLNWSRTSAKRKQGARDTIPLVEQDERVLVPLDVHQAVIEKIQNDDNLYATSKSNSQNMLNISVIQTQILQLVNVSKRLISGWEAALISMLSLSLSLQFTIFVLLVLLAQSKTEQVTKYCMATGMNSLVTSLSGLLLIITSAITILSTISESYLMVAVNTTTAAVARTLLIF